MNKFDMHKLCTGQLKTNKSCGPENCHPYVLKKVKEGLVVPLYYLYSKSLKEANLPLRWKEATITAVFKKVTESFQTITVLLV